MGLSRRACATLRGVHESSVRKAIASGRITTEADGTIDAAKADAMCDASTDPAKQRGAHARVLGRGMAATRAAPTRTGCQCASGSAPARRESRNLTLVQKP